MLLNWEKIGWKKWMYVIIKGLLVNEKYRVVCDENLLDWIREKISGWKWVYVLMVWICLFIFILNEEYKLKRLGLWVVKY